MKNIVKKIGLSSFLLITIMLFSGCEATKALNTALGIPNSPQEYVANSSDKYLANIFSKYFDKKNHISLRTMNSDMIKLNVDSITFYDQVSQRDAQEEIGRKFENDTLVSEYKEAIIKRNNTFKVYQNAFNKILLKKAFNLNGKLKTRDDIAKYTYDWTPAIIEYDKNGKIVSTMIRTYEISVAYNQFRDPLAPVSIDTSVWILTDYKARSLQNKIRNTVFNDYLLYSSK